MNSSFYNLGKTTKSPFAQIYIFITSTPSLIDKESFKRDNSLFVASWAVVFTIQGWNDCNLRRILIVFFDWVIAVLKVVKLQVAGSSCHHLLRAA